MGFKARATGPEGDERDSASWVLPASLALYAVSFLPALAEPQRDAIRGYATFLMASLGPAIYAIAGVALLVRESDPRGLLVALLLFLPWSANLAYWLAAHRLHSGRSRGVATLVTLAVLLGLSAAAVSTAFWLSFPADRRGPPPYVYREGYWLWLGSMALLGHRGREGRARLEVLAQACDD